MRRMILPLFSLTALAGCTQDAPRPPAVARPDSVTIVNAKVWTGDAAQPWAEAVLIRGSEISLVGSNAQVQRAASSGSERIDAGGRLVVPGFIDTHVHFVEGGMQLASVQLRDARTREQFVTRIQQFAATVPEGTWILGGGWDHTLWGGELPTRDWIDAVTQRHPVWVNRLDGHMALANSAALAAAGVTRATREVDGGEIVRAADGEATGVLKDNAMALVDKVVPTPAPALLDRALAEAMRAVNANGVTSIHHMGSWGDLEVFARAARAGTLTTRIYAAVPLADWSKLNETVQARTYGGADGRGNDWLRIGLLKGFVDGSLGSHTAAFHQPFDDAPADRGLLVNTPENLYAWISGADRAGLHVAVHAIGDRANTLLLDTYARIAQENGARDRRLRVEHAQHLRSEDIPRFSQLGVIASMQPYHLSDDGRWAEPLIGKRIATTYAFRDLLDHEARLAFGSDWPVAPATPLEGIYAAVTRRTLDDKNPEGWVPQQKISVAEALHSYTTDAAFASYEESRKGVLAAGYLADLVMLDRDLFAIPPPQIREAKVVMTIVGGRIVAGTKPAAQ
jgi:predicted amidohydrolase YtcJ